MKKLLALSLLGLFLAPVIVITIGYAQEEALVLREAQELRDNVVAVEAYLTGNIMEVKVTARMPESRPNIYNVIIVGPRLGRLAPESIETLQQTIDSDEEEPYPTKERGGFVSFRERTKDRKAKGRLARELIVFDIPTDRIVKDKKYKLWVQIKSEQEAGYRQKGGRYITFKFDLDKLPELVAQSQ